MAHGLLKLSVLLSFYFLEVLQLKNRCFCWFPVAIFMPLKGTPTWRLQTKLYKIWQNVFPNISHMKYRIDLILEEAFCIFIVFHLPDSGLSVLNGFAFLFLMA